MQIKLTVMEKKAARDYAFLPHLAQLEQVDAPSWPQVAITVYLKTTSFQAQINASEK